MNPNVRVFRSLSRLIAETARGNSKYTLGGVEHSSTLFVLGCREDGVEKTFEDARLGRGYFYGEPIPANVIETVHREIVRASNEGRVHYRAKRDPSRDPLDEIEGKVRWALRALLGSIPPSYRPAERGFACRFDPYNTFEYRLSGATPGVTVTFL